MLHLLATGANAKSILELGTSYGYSTIWLADAARATGGKVVSLELRSASSTMRRRAARAGLADFVEFRVGSALDTLPASRDPSTWCCSTCGRTCTSPAWSFCIQS